MQTCSPVCELWEKKKRQEEREREGGREGGRGRERERWRGREEAPGTLARNKITVVKLMACF